MAFNSLGLPKTILHAIEENKLTKPYPIQEMSIPKAMNGLDILGIAKTGSGKTLAFALPILSKLSKFKRLKSRKISGLILVPTRELAEQVKDVFNQIGPILPNKVRTMAVYGGVSINPQMKNLYGCLLYTSDAADD